MPVITIAGNDGIEIEKKREGFENRRRVVHAFSEKPIESMTVLLCTIWVITRIVTRRFGLIHILIEAAVIIWAIGEEKRPLAIKNLGIFLKYNKAQSVAFVISLMVIFFCITSGTGEFIFFVALCVLIWSIKSAKKRGLIIDDNFNVKYIHVKGRYDYIGKPCELVVEELMASGFTDIQTFENKDLIKGWIAKEGDVSGIWINGKCDFENGDDFPSDARVVIEYHVFRD